MEEIAAMQLRGLYHHITATIHYKSHMQYNSRNIELQKDTMLIHIFNLLFFLCVISYKS